MHNREGIVVRHGRHRRNYFSESRSLKLFIFWLRLFLVTASVVAVGAVFLVASLPDGTRLLAARAGWSWLAGPAEASAALKAALPPVSSLLAWVGYALACYVAALVLVSWRHRRTDLVGWGLGALVVSTFALHGLSWVLVFARFVAKVIGTVVGFLAGIVVWVALQLYEYLVKPYVGLFGPLGGLGWVVAVAVVVVVLWVAYEARATWAAGAVWLLGGVGLVVVVVLGVRWLAGLAPAWFWEKGAVLLGWMIGCAVCSGVGRLVLDQLRSGVHAGSGRRGVAMGAIAVGSALAVLMLVGDIHGAYTLYPSDVENWARAVLLSDAPKLDAAVTVLVIGLCALGVLRNLGRMREEPGMAEFRRSLVFAVVGACLAGGIAGVDRDTSG